MHLHLHKIAGLVCFYIQLIDLFVNFLKIIHRLCKNFKKLSAYKWVKFAREVKCNKTYNNLYAISGGTNGVMVIVVDYHIIFTNPSTLAGYDTRSIFKQSVTGLNPELSFS